MESSRFLIGRGNLAQLEVADNASSALLCCLSASRPQHSTHSSPLGLLCAVMRHTDRGIYPPINHYSVSQRLSLQSGALEFATIRNPATRPCKNNEPSQTGWLIIWILGAQLFGVYIFVTRNFFFSHSPSSPNPNKRCVCVRAHMCVLNFIVRKGRAALRYYVLGSHMP